jgi:hypothetical protein
MSRRTFCAYQRCSLKQTVTLYLFLVPLTLVDAMGYAMSSSLDTCLVFPSKQCSPLRDSYGLHSAWRRRDRIR